MRKGAGNDMSRYISIDDAIKIVTKAMEFGDYNKLIAVSNALYEAPAADGSKW